MDVFSGFKGTHPNSSFDGNMEPKCSWLAVVLMILRLNTATGHSFGRRMAAPRSGMILQAVKCFILAVMMYQILGYIYTHDYITSPPRHIRILTISSEVLTGIDISLVLGQEVPWSDRLPLKIHPLLQITLQLRRLPRRRRITVQLRRIWVVRAD